MTSVAVSSAKGFASHSVLCHAVGTWSIALVLLAGCGASEPAVTVSPPPKPPPQVAAKKPAAAKPLAAKPAPPQSPPKKPLVEKSPASDDNPVPPSDVRPAEDAPLDPAREIRPDVDEAVVEKSRLRKLVGKHLTIYTDVPSSPAVDELPQVFDLAVPQWCDYFHIDPARVATWHVRGSLMREPRTFVEAGLLPGDLPDFQHGFARRFDLWLNEQPSDYYRRHLLLHEGTHAIVNAARGSAGPPWYMEGVAELLATHRWADGKLTLRILPPRREDVPDWGRIKLLRDDIQAGQGLPLNQVLAYDRRAHVETRAYAWSWGAAAFLDGHPRYRERFRQLDREVHRSDEAFHVQWRQLYQDDLAQLAEEWQVFAASVEYGHDLERTVIDFRPGKPLPAAGARATVAADRGWQNSGWRVSADQPVRLKASGRYQVAERPKIWWCEPGGVSFRYYAGQPLGRLLAAVRADAPDVSQPSAFLQPLVVGLGGELKPPRSGTLFFRINDSPGELADNRGSLTVEIGTTPTR